MSVSSQPISPARFALALRDLPASSLYAKSQEILNSIAHLERSNLALQQYSDEIANDESISVETRGSGDKDCLDAIQENDVVIARQRERLILLKQEVERRGGRWHEADGEEKNSKDGAEGGLNGHLNGHIGDGTETEGSSQPGARGPQSSGAATSSSGGHLNDEDLQRLLAQRLEEDDENEDEGMHL